MQLLFRVELQLKQHIYNKGQQIKKRENERALKHYKMTIFEGGKHLGGPSLPSRWVRFRFPKLETQLAAQ